MDFARNATGSNKRLFDPERDNPFSNPVVRKNKRLQNPRYLVGQSPMACVDFKENQLWLAVHEAVDSHPQEAYPLDKHSNLRGSGQNKRKTAPGDQPTHPPASQDCDLECDTEIEMEPILLLQPQTRPISHDQLVVEVKGIYAGLVMVESICVTKLFPTSTMTSF